MSLDTLERLLQQSTQMISKHVEIIQAASLHSKLQSYKISTHVAAFYVNASQSSFYDTL